jgi:hypothetical protein
MLQNLDAIASTFGIVAPPAFVALLVGILVAQLFLVDRRRRHSRHVERLVDEFRAMQRSTAHQLHQFMEEYEHEVGSGLEPGDNGAVERAYAHYRERQQHTIQHLEGLSDALRQRLRNETLFETVAHQVLDYFANQQGAR